MAQRKAISVELRKEQRSILERQLETGRYADASDVINDALSLMSARDAVFDEWLRNDVQASLADTRPARGMDQVFKRVRARLDRAAKAGKHGA